MTDQLNNPKDIEIYVHGISEQEVYCWLDTFLKDRAETFRDVNQVVLTGTYNELKVPVILNLNVEIKGYTGIWFNSGVLPWKSDIACAREAHRWFRSKVLCDPGSDYPLPNLFLETSSDGESVVDIDNLPV